ncbi:hypothetical protein BS78_09G204500 [Paspalum vaginatum]|nr:hypothetical protein BS78_09G204500 [Paspalum vaginatum]
MPTPAILAPMSLEMPLPSVPAPAPVIPALARHPIHLVRTPCGSLPRLPPPQPMLVHHRRLARHALALDPCSSWPPPPFPRPAPDLCTSRPLPRLPSPPRRTLLPSYVPLAVTLSPRPSPPACGPSSYTPRFL